MDVIETRWPEVNTHIAAQLSNDSYIRWHIRQDFEGNASLYVYGQRDAQDIMRLARTPSGLQVWLEARTDGSRVLLRDLPMDEEVSISLGTPLGLELVQEELTGIVKVLSLFCMVDKRRFRPSQVHPVSKLECGDWEALQRYPASLNRDAFFGLFDAGVVDLYGSYKDNEIAGYAVGIDDGMASSWVHVSREFRGQGYGRSLLSVCASDLLQEHETVFFDACMDEMANFRVCLSVGFIPLRQMSNFEGRRSRENYASGL